MFKRAPIQTTLMVGGMIALGIACPPAALALGGGLLGYAALQTGGDPRRLGELAGETAFWGATGFAGARVVKGLAGTPQSPVAPPTLRTTPFLPAPPRPVVPAPKPVVHTPPKPVVPAPTPLVPAPKPLVPAPKPLVPAPKPVVPAPKPVVPVVHTPPKPVVPAPVPLPRPPRMPQVKPLAHLDDATLMRWPILPGEKFDGITGLPTRKGQQYHGQLFIVQNGRPIVSPRSMSAVNFDTRTGLPLADSQKPAALRLRPLTWQEEADFALARVRRAAWDQEHRGRAQTWVRDLKNKGLADWQSSGLDPHTMLRDQWSKVNAGGYHLQAGRSQNCAFNAWAGEETLAGRPIQALVDNRAALDGVITRGTPSTFLERAFGGTFKEFAGEDAIAAELARTGDGSRGIVMISSGKWAHVFNAVVWKGKTYFLDFQTGRPATFAGAKKFQLLRTASGT